MSNKNSFLARKSRGTSYARAVEGLQKRSGPHEEPVKRNCKRKHIFMGGKPYSTRKVTKIDPKTGFRQTYLETVSLVERTCRRCGLKETLTPFDRLNLSLDGEVA